MDDADISSQIFWDKLTDVGWNIGERTAFILGNEMFDNILMKTELLKSILEKNITNGIVLFDTKTMLDERRRVENFLIKSGYDDFEIDSISDVRVHRRILSVNDNYFKNRWLIAAKM